MKTLFVIFLLPFIISCSKPTPETLLGLRLGMPFENEIQNLIDQKQIYYYKDKYAEVKYIIYSGYIGKFYCSGSELNENNQKLLDEVFIEFVTLYNPDLPKDEKDNISENRYLRTSDTSKIITQYQEKYGFVSPISEWKDGYFCSVYKWNKGDLIIGLYVAYWNQVNSHAFAKYEYTDDIKKQIEYRCKQQDSKRF